MYSNILKILENEIDIKNLLLIAKYFKIDTDNLSFNSIASSIANKIIHNNNITSTSLGYMLSKSQIEFITNDKYLQRLQLILKPVDNYYKIPDNDLIDFIKFAREESMYIGKTRTIARTTASGNQNILQELNQKETRFRTHIPQFFDLYASFNDIINEVQNKIDRDTLIDWLIMLYQHNDLPIKDLFRKLKEILFSYKKMKMDMNELLEYLNIEEIENLQNYKVILDTDNVQVVIPFNRQTSCYFGRNTRWCTAGKERNAFTNYSERGNLFIIIPKRPTRPTEKYQLWIENQKPYGENKEGDNKTELNDELKDFSFMNEEDTRVNISYLTKKYPELLEIPIIKKYEYVHYINDSENYNDTVIKYSVFLRDVFGIFSKQAKENYAAAKQISESTIEEAEKVFQDITNSFLKTIKDVENERLKHRMYYSIEDIELKNKIEKIKDSIELQTQEIQNILDKSETISKEKFELVTRIYERISKINSDTIERVNNYLSNYEKFTKLIELLNKNYKVAEYKLIKKFNMVQEIRQSEWYSIVPKDLGSIKFINIYSYEDTVSRLLRQPSVLKNLIISTDKGLFTIHDNNEWVLVERNIVLSKMACNFRECIGINNSDNLIYMASKNKLTDWKKQENLLTNVVSINWSRKFEMFCACGSVENNSFAYTYDYKNSNWKLYPNLPPLFDISSNKHNTVAVGDKVIIILEGFKYILNINIINTPYVWKSIDTDGTKFIAVGEEPNKLAYSSFGKLWRFMSINDKYQNVIWNIVKYCDKLLDKKLWVLGGSDNGKIYIAYSINGTHWIINDITNTTKGEYIKKIESTPNEIIILTDSEILVSHIQYIITKKNTEQMYQV